MLRIGVIGYGYWGPNLVRNFYATPGCTLAAVSDLREERLEAVRSRFPTVKTTTDYRQLLADDSLNAIAVATPVSSHFPLAMEALEAGKHVFVEKPMTTTAEE